MRSFAVLPLFLVLAMPLFAEPLSSQRQGELQELLHQDCGSCHGMRLTGGLGPPLTPQALEGKPRELLVVTISEGRSGTPMPPWKALLSESEIGWLVDYMRNQEVKP
jgi:cytochrome c55X